MIESDESNNGSLDLDELSLNPRLRMAQLYKVALDFMVHDEFENI